MDDVIILGKLDKKELEKSIGDLVNYVEAGTKKMATDFDNAIEGMKRKLQSLGSLSTGTNGSADGAGRAKRNKEEVQSVKELKVSYDQLSAATQRATMQPKSAQDSFYTFIQSYREHAAALARELKQMPSASLDRQFAEYQRFEAEIERVRMRIQELRVALNEVGRNPNSSRFEVKAITDEIGILENKVKQLTTEQLQSTRRIAAEDNAVFAQKQAELDKQRQTLRELTSEQQRQTTISSGQIADEQRKTEEIRRQAQAIRESASWKQKGIGYYEYTTTEDGVKKLATQMVYAKSTLSIEEQILQIQRRVAEEKERRERAEQRERQGEREGVVTAQQRLTLEQQITQEQAKRSRYITPSVGINESFKSMLGNKLGIDKNEINSTSNSVKNLQTYLNQLTMAYQRLSGAERTTPFGKQLRDEIQIIGRQVQKLRTEMGRPITLQVVKGLSEKTLDDIAYKMRMLSTYRQGLDLKTQSGDIRQVTAEMERLKKKQDEVIGSTRSWAKENSAVSRSLEYMKNRLAFIFTIGASTAFVKQIYDIRGQYELLERSIGILVDSLQEGSQIFAELNAMAIKSPFTTMELGAAAKQLTAYDIAAKDVVDTTKRIADMAAAVGVPIERLTYALGQIKAYGYLNARDARMFANAGIPLVQNLADRYTELEGRLVSVGDVYDRIKKKAISFEDVMDVINSITDEGGRFFNFQEKAADTLKVKLANLTLAYNNMLNAIGKSNQSLLTMPLTALKTLFEHWRDLNNIIKSVAVTFGVLKAAQIAYYAFGQKVGLSFAFQYTMGQKVMTMLRSLGASFVSFATNPFALATAGLALFGFALAKAAFDYQDLLKANEEFNRTISTNAKENIGSIDKFFGEYQKKLDGIGGETAAEQQKLWERIQEEIEKTTKNADGYLLALNDIEDVTQRISFGKEILEQTREINKETQRLADRGLFNIGGGFADDELAQNLKNYNDVLNEIRNKYGSVTKAAQAHTMASRKLMADLYSQQSEVNKELDNFVSILDNADIGRIMGDDPKTQLDNIRAFATIIRDNFLATEKGQKIGVEGQANLNKKLDEWIAKQGLANGVIRERTTLNQKYSAEEIASVESSRTAWETFFSQLNKKDKERLDYLVKSNQTGSKDFQEIWDKATKRMAENATTAYSQIQEQIASLRDTPDIVINVVYRETKEKLDAQQQAYEDYFIRPKDWVARNLSADEYLAEEAENRRRYGRLMKKENEDNVEWEKRLGEEYRSNEESIKKLNKQLKNSATLSDVDREAKENELKTLKDQNKVLEEIRERQNFDYTKEKKSGGKGSKKDPLGEALQKEIQLVTDIQKLYKEYQKAGVDAETAKVLAAKEYNKTLATQNATLRKFNIRGLTGEQLASMDLRQVRDYYQGMLETATKLGNTKGVEALEKALRGLNEEITKIDYKKITEGLNNELGKLKDEYELAIELDASPELGDMFADMFDIDMESLPRSFGEALDRAQQIIDTKLSELNVRQPFDLLRTQIESIGVGEGKTKGFAELAGLDMKGDAIQGLLKWQQTFRDMFKKNITETEKMLDDYVKKYGGYADRMAEIEADRLQKVKRLNEAYYTEEMRRLPEYVAKMSAIEKGAEKERGKVKFDEFKDSRLYVAMFENLEYASTATLEAIREKLQGLKDDMGQLTPEQLKQVTQQFEKIDRELLRRNPFKGLIKNAKDYARALGADGKKAQETFRTAQRKYDWELGTLATLKQQFEQKKAQQPLDADERIKLQEQVDEQQKKVDKLKEELELAEELNEKYDMMRILFGEQAKEIAKTLQTIAANLQSLGELRDTLQETFGFEFSHSINGAIDSLMKVGSGLSKITSSAQSGDAVGVVTGVVQTAAGIGDTIASIFGDGAARTRRINREIENSVEVVRRLNMAYKELERQATHAMGAEELRARRSQIENKKAQLAELERQMQLEQSKRSKDRDDDAIKQYEESIQDLRYEIADLVEDITNTLLGSDLKGASEEFVSVWVDAWRQGGDTMDALKGKFDDMIDTMIAKSLASSLVSERLEGIWKAVKDATSDLSEGGVDITMDELQKIRELIGDKTIAEQINDDLTKLYGALNIAYGSGVGGGKNLSLLQQGIEGISEETAGALEAMMNGMSQQIYLHSDLLTQIRDTLIGFDMDVQTGALSQILLQLQSSYQVQMSIHGILEGVLNPSGRAFNVELLS